MIGEDMTTPEFYKTVLHVPPLLGERVGVREDVANSPFVRLKPKAS